MIFAAAPRWMLVALGVIGILAIIALGLGTIWLNSFIHSDTFRHEVESHATQSLGGPVEIKQIDLSVWGGVKLNGLATKLVTAQGTLVAQVESVSCSCSLVALLGGKVQLDGLTLKNPQIVLTQEAPSSVAMPRPANPEETGRAGPDKTENGKTAPLQFTLDTAKIVDGHLSIRDATGVTKADLQGIQVRAETGGYFTGKDVTGSLKIATVSLPQNLSLIDFSTPFTYRNGTVEANAFQATAFSGQITGDYKLDPSGPSLLNVNATGINMAQVGQASNPGSPTQLTGLMDLQSKWQSVETGSLRGNGDAQISHGRLVGVTILDELATAFQLKEMNDPDLKSVTVHFEVANGTTHFDHLLINSTVFDMSGHGRIDPQGGLDADMMLTLHPDAMKQIPGIAVPFFSKNSDGGASIPFHLTGTAANTQSDLLTRLFINGSKVRKTISKTLDQLFH